MKTATTAASTTDRLKEGRQGSESPAALLRSWLRCPTGARVDGEPPVAARPRSASGRSPPSELPSSHPRAVGIPHALLRFYTVRELVSGSIAAWVRRAGVDP